jgi:hypothetical protein
MSQIGKKRVEFSNWEGNVTALLDVALYYINRQQERIYDVHLIEGEWPSSESALIHLVDKGLYEDTSRYSRGKVDLGDNEKHRMVTIFP